MFALHVQWPVLLQFLPTDPTRLHWHCTQPCPVEFQKYSATHESQRRPETLDRQKHWPLLEHWSSSVKRRTGKATHSVSTVQLKVPMKWKLIAAYLKGFSKKRRMVVFFFGIPFFVMEIFTFFYYANEESDDVIHVGGSTKTVQHSITNTSRNIRAVFFQLGTRNQPHKRRKMTLVVLLPWQQLCRWSCFN